MTWSIPTLWWWLIKLLMHTLMMMMYTHWQDLKVIYSIEECNKNCHWCIAYTVKWWSDWLWWIVWYYEDNVTQPSRDQWQSRHDMTNCIAEPWTTECYTYTYSYEDLDNNQTLMIDKQTMQSCSSEEWWAVKRMSSRDWPVKRWVMLTIRRWTEQIEESVAAVDHQQ